MSDSEKNTKIEESLKKLFSFESNNYIFIYTPPKVGSTTLVSSLRISLGKSYNIIHIHDDIMLNVLTGINNITIIEIINYLALKGKIVYVIDVYRTPVERKMSTFFEKICSIHFNNTEEQINNYNINRIINRFNNLYPHLNTEEHYFEKFNICDPIPFDFEKKFTIQTNNNTHFIKLRLLDSQIWDKILSNILQIDVVLINDYNTENKKIGELYKRFKNEYKLPYNFFEMIKTCKYFNFYYSYEERNNYLSFWESRLSDAVTPYSDYEYEIYLRISLENQINYDIQFEHYIDNGCFCKGCSLKRREYYFKAKKGEKITEKIIHTQVVNEIINDKNQKIIKLCKHIREITKKNSQTNIKSKAGKKFGIDTKLVK